MRAPMVVLPCPLILPGQDPAAEPLTASHARHERLFQQLNSIVSEFVISQLDADPEIGQSPLRETPARGDNSAVM